ncbi:MULTISPECIES: hypothetical protein [Nostocales]|uniref:Uncharacterized protein n=3 Tax=Nostocales TaxID=1161 RepID=A0A0C1QXK6_9CYAN|nr:hypothetical protein [Tolypothrix bouteillei]KAF3886180.1 hypothetical protein DA73_0400012385 [Tolypothrix bouteillei VB521301]
MAFSNVLNQLPKGTQETFELIADFDRCFLVGFANLDTQHLDTLNSLQQIFTGTPLQQPISKTYTALQSHEFLDRHFMILATARASLQGALFDTLQQQARSGLGRMVEDTGDTGDKEDDGLRVWLESIRHWLMEIALTGYARLEAPTLIPFMATLEQIQSEPRLVRQAALLTGFFNELMSWVPVADTSTIPIYRWVDLWTQAMVGAIRPPVTPQPEIVSGTLELLGLDLRHHSNVVSFTAYGLLKVDALVQWVRLTLSAYKVDAISGDQIWLLFPNAAVLLHAFAENRALHLKDIPLLPTGDLLWQGEAQLGKNYNLMHKASEFFAIDATNNLNFPAIPPVDRHPVQLAEPIFLKDYAIARQDNTLMLKWKDGGVLPIATERMSSLSEINTEDISKSTELFGLLRFNAGCWAVQPLVATVQGKTIFSGQGAAKVLNAPPKNSVVTILQERASRLLRKKS